MTASLIIVGIWSGVLLFLSLAISGAFGGLYAGSYYPANLPFILSAGVLVVLALAGLAVQRARAAVFWIAVPLHGLLLLPAAFALSRWPGGDDGPGMAWLFFVVGGSCLASALAVILVAIRLVMVVREQRNTGSAM